MRTYPVTCLWEDLPCYIPLRGPTLLYTLERTYPVIYPWEDLPCYIPLRGPTLLHTLERTYPVTYPWEDLPCYMPFSDWITRLHISFYYETRIYYCWIIFIPVSYKTLRDFHSPPSGIFPFCTLWDFPFFPKFQNSKMFKEMIQTFFAGIKFFFWCSWIPAGFSFPIFMR